MQNLEIKAVYPNLEFAAQIANSVGARKEWVHKQHDTYFQMDSGKLKLREVEGQPSELIYYQRPADANIKTSNYHIFSTENAEQLTLLLNCFLKTKLVIKKIRTLYLWHNVRIHLDQVEQLGNFIEFEAVISEQNNHNISQERVNYLLKEFAITPDALQATGYYELIHV